MNVLIRCDGSVEIGMGHVVRCLALAEELREQSQWTISFAMRGSELGINKVRPVFPVVTPKVQNDSFDYEYWLKECIEKTQANVLILDVRDGLSRTALRTIRQSSELIIVTIDDPEDKRLEVDLAFYPPVPQLKRIDYTDFTGKLYAGWGWVILRKEFYRARRQRTQNKKTAILTRQSSVPSVLVTMGSSDPQGMTFKAIKALERLDEDFKTIVVLGEGFQHKEELRRVLSYCKNHFDVRENIQNVAELMSQSDLAITSFGVTAYELAAIGIPAIYLCLTEDHAESASIFVQADIAVNAGVNDRVSEAALAHMVEKILVNVSARLTMTENAKRLPIGKGVSDIARVIQRRIESIDD